MASLLVYLNTSFNALASDDQYLKENFRIHAHYLSFAGDLNPSNSALAWQILFVVLIVKFTWLPVHIAKATRK